MNSCTVCDDSFRNDNPNKVICDGLCRQAFHAECVNFSKDALPCYREMPNLQWFCDACITQTRSFNVSSSPFNRLNSTVVIPTSSPSYVQRSLPAVNRKRKPIPRAKQTESSVSLITKHLNCNRDTKKAIVLSMSPPINKMQSTHPVDSTNAISRSDLVHYKPKHNAVDSDENCTETSKPEIQSSPNINHLLKKANSLSGSPRKNKIKPVNSPDVINQTDVHQPKHSTEVYEKTQERDIEPPGLKITSDTSSSFAEVLTTSSIAERPPTYTKSSSIPPDKDSNLPPSIVSPSKSQKIAYLSNFDPSTTEEQMVGYLLRKNIISSPEDVSCKKLVSPYENIDLLSFVSFKVTATSEIFHALVDDKLWPDGITAREFVKR